MYYKLRPRGGGITIMKTITFYSYKGGVGRTLALVNIARRLAEFGKTVCLLDFDLEAPGLIHKYRHDIQGKVEKGLVDYIYEFAIDNIVPKSVSDYSVKIPGEKITLIPAGNSEKGDYWKKLSRINWWSLFYEEGSEGIPFFLDLKDKIEKEIKPDYLLIDTRTGVTEISSVTMSLLADTIVLLGVNNHENLRGTNRIIETITADENNIFDKETDIHFVFSRIPTQTTPEGRAREAEVLKAAESSVRKAFEINGKELKSFNVIHSDREMELNERINIGYDFERGEGAVSSISLEYLNLFNNLMKDDFSPEEIEKFNRVKQMDKLRERAFATVNNNIEAIPAIVEQMLAIDKSSSVAYFFKGIAAMKQEKYNEAIGYFNDSIKYGDVSGQALYFRGFSNYVLQNYHDAISDFELYLKENHGNYRMDARIRIICAKQCLGYPIDGLLRETTDLIARHPLNAELLNLRSNFYRDNKQYEQALADVYKAIELNADNGLFYSTLAEIKLSQNDMLDFYRNFDLALSKGFAAKGILRIPELDLYRTVFEDEKFISILKKHDQFEALDRIEKHLNSGQN
jgi:MinD-like ATPase involved in chromosome partitioning or flagellar assembly